MFREIYAQIKSFPTSLSAVSWVTSFGKIGFALHDDFSLHGGSIVNTSFPRMWLVGCTFRYVLFCHKIVVSFGDAHGASARDDALPGHEDLPRCVSVFASTVLLRYRPVFDCFCDPPLRLSSPLLLRMSSTPTGLSLIHI